MVDRFYFKGKMKHTIFFIASLLMICSCDNHDFELNEKKQEFYINNLLYFSIEHLDTLHGGYSYAFSKKNYQHSGIDTLPLKKSISREIHGIKYASRTKEFIWDPSYIRLKPNTRYLVKHLGMGARVDIRKYYYTDSLGNMHLQE